jgi:hypothetical protein
MEAFLVLMIVFAAAIAGALEFLHLFELLTGALEGPRPRPAAPPSEPARDDDDLVTTRLAA